MARRGHRVYGFDICQGSVDFAHQVMENNGLPGVYWQADMREFAITSAITCDIAFNLVSSFKHLYTKEDVRRHMTCMHAVLKTGAIYVIGLHIVDYQDRKGEREQWLAQRDGVTVRATIVSSCPDILTCTEHVRIRMIVRDEQKGSKDVKYLETSFEMRTYNCAELFELVSSINNIFELVECFDFAHDITKPRDPRLNPCQLAVILVLRAI